MTAEKLIIVDSKKNAYEFEGNLGDLLQAYLEHFSPEVVLVLFEDVYVEEAERFIDLSETEFMEFVIGVKTSNIRFPCAVLFFEREKIIVRCPDITEASSEIVIQLEGNRVKSIQVKEFIYTDNLEYKLRIKNEDEMKRILEDFVYPCHLIGYAREKAARILKIP